MIKSVLWEGEYTRVPQPGAPRQPGKQVRAHGSAGEEGTVLQAQVASHHSVSN